VGAFYNGVRDLEQAVNKQSPRQAQRAFAKISLAYDHYLKAGDLYERYEDDGDDAMAGKATYGPDYFDDLSSMRLSYVAPSIEAPGLQDDVVLLKGPDKARKGVVLWVFKGENGEPANVVVKLQPRAESDSESAAAPGGGGDQRRGEFSGGVSTHREVRTYPYAYLAKTTPPEVQFADDFLAAYVASAISRCVHVW